MTKKKAKKTAVKKAKKTKKKVVRKKAAKKTRKASARKPRGTEAPSPIILPYNQAQAMWAEKVAQVRIKSGGGCPQTGKYPEGDVPSEDIFPYTRAREINDFYCHWMDTEKLIVVPGLVLQIVREGHWYAIAKEYECIDRETGFGKVGSGVGIGNNSVWATHSAQTVARKQYLLELFSASWDDHVEEQILAAAAEGMRTGNPSLVREAIGDYFDYCLQGKRAQQMQETVQRRRKAK